MSKPEEKNISSSMAIFEDAEIRRILVGDDWHYSVVDVIAALTDSSNPRRYWSDLKIKMTKEEGSQLYDLIVQLKLPSADGKKYRTDCADNEGILRIIQSVPSKRAEPFKKWLAKVGAERIEEIQNPGKAIERAKGYWISKGYSPQWVESRMASIEARVAFTETLKGHGIKEGHEYAILTNEMYESWSGLSASQYRDFKGISNKDSLRDHMSLLEVASTIFSEATASEILSKTEAKSFFETRQAIHIAGKITKEAIEKIEKTTGKKVVTHDNNKDLNSPEIQKKLIQEDSENKKLKNSNDALDTKTKKS